MHDLIIGAASNYGWKELELWVNSIKKSGFHGDVMLVGTNMSKETIDKLTSNGILLELYGQRGENGDITSPVSNAPHVERFFYLWNALETIKKQYRYVITTDTRDVIFQKNPSDWIEEHSADLILSSEGMLYKDEPWGKKNYEECFGSYFFKRIENRLINNVGVIAGGFDNVKSLMLMIYQLSLQRPIAVVDQATFNFIINDDNYAQLGKLFTNNHDGWAIQLGTTIEAVRSGAGDLGQLYRTDPNFKYEYQDMQPKIYGDGKVVNDVGTVFTIVHQYDRVPYLKEKMQKLYGDVDDTNDESRIIFHHPI